MANSRKFSAWIFIMLIILLYGCKKIQNEVVDPGSSVDTGQVVKTEKGIPLGEIVTMNIGPEGGTIVSSDEGATLVVPRGALATNTVISIQTISKTLPEGLGDHAYQFLPEGLMFAVPARLTLRYDTLENHGSSAAGLVIANQEPDGSWMHDAEVIADENRFTLTGDMEHFSVWMIVKAIKISPARSTLELGGKVGFLIQALDKYIPVAKTGTRRKKAKIKWQSTYSWIKESAEGFTLSGWRLNYNNAPGLPKDGSLKIVSNPGVFAEYTAPMGSPPERNPVLIQAVLSNNINVPNLIANASVFVRKNGYLKATIGGRVYNYVQHIGEPSSSDGIVNASVLPFASGKKIVVNALDLNNGNRVSLYFSAIKGINKIVFKRDEEFVAVSTSSIESWQQEYYTRENGIGTTRCKEYGPKYSELEVNLSEFNGGFSDWFSGNVTGILYHDTDKNRSACKNSDLKNVKIEFVLKAGF